MFEFLDLFSNARDLAPHGYCLLWDPALVWTHVLADGLIAAAYFSIPVAILRFVRGRKDIEFSWIFWLFALFILACGTTHLMAIWTLWNPDYQWEAVIKVITAIASVGTAIVLWPLIPRALALPSPLQLKEANSQLSERVRERDSALEQLKKEITDRERAEAALAQAQKMEAVGQLTGGIAHDFNNLLTVVIGGLDMVQRSTEEPRTKRIVTSALEAAERGAKLTGQLLAFSRTQRLRLEPVIVAPLIENMRELISHTLGPAVQLELQLDEAGVAVLADANQLELAVLNLAINARDAMPQGGGLAISTRYRRVSGDPELADGEYLELRVSDTGTGMAEEVRAKAFDPFFTTKDVGKGTGLGLSMVYGVARQSGGTARIESREGRGTTVSVLLPRASGAVSDHASSAGPVRSAPYGRLKILVVDDEPAVRQVLADGLAEEGNDVTAATDGPEGLEHLRRERFDLLIVDFAMPLMNGAEVVKAARLIRPDQKVLFVTGYSDTAAIEEAAVDAPVVRKPFRPADMAAAIGAAVENANSGENGKSG